MERFSRLFLELDETTRTHEKVEAMERYFAEVPPADAAWALFFLCGGKIPRVMLTRELREAIAAETQFPDWLIDECQEAVGDLAETLSLLFPTEG